MAVLVATAGQVQAAVVTYTDKTSFMAALASSSTDNFDDLSPGFVSAPLIRNVGPYTYQATAINGLYTAGSNSDVWLSTNAGIDSLNFTINAGGPTAIGGYFFSTDIFGDVISDTVSVSINGGLFAQSVSTNSATNFFGWVSTDGTQISSLSVSVSSSWSTVNDLILGTATVSAVPEPSSLAIFGIGAYVAGIGAVRRRRREKQQ
jgi:hypothetical protein